MRDQLEVGIVDRVTARALGVLRVVRPLTCVMAGISAAYGCWFARPLGYIDPAVYLLAALAMATVMGFAHTVNDIVDVSLDQLSKPDRPIPSGRLSRRWAGVLASVLATTALVSSAALGVGAAAGTALLLGLGFGYSLWWKGTVLVGNVVVATVCAATLVFGAWATGDVTSPALVAAAVIFLFMIAYELVKTLQDREADAAGGLVTLATRCGSRTTVRGYAAAAVALSVTALVGGGATSTRPSVFVAAVLICLLGPVWISVALLVRHDGSPRAIALSLTVLRLVWLPGLTALTLLK